MISPMTVHSRLVNTNPNYRTSLTSQWSFKEYDKSEFKCRGGWLVLSDVLNENPNELEGHAAKRLFMGGKIGRLKDGGLVLGQKVTISGQLDSFFSWGGQSYGTYTVADHDMWYWIKLERIGATGNGVKPDDASASSNAQARSAAAGVGAKRDAEEQEARQAAQDKRIREHRAR